MLEVAVRLILGGVLAGAGLAKLASPGTSRAALSTFGVADRRAQAVLWAGLIATELGLAAGVIAGSDAAAYAAAALTAIFAATMAGAMMRGLAGAPCACFGARSTVSALAVARNLVLAACFAALPMLPAEDLSTDQWLGLGLGLALLLCAGLAVAVLALAREVGMLRLRLGPDSALELESEGPPLGSRAAAIDRFRLAAEAELAVAVFSSPGCRICEAMKPTVSALERDPVLAVGVFDEHSDAAVWRALEVPGSPYAIVLDLTGVVLAKGAFNNLAQLESVLATAERRRDDRGSIEAIGV